VITLFISSISSGAGKTTVCAGIGKYLVNQGKKVGYLNPSILPEKQNVTASFMKEILSLPEPLDFICPTFENENRLTSSIKKLIDAISGGKDIVLVENSNLNAAIEAAARVIPVVSYLELIDGAAINTCKVYAQQIAGIVINKVPASQMHDVWTEKTVPLKLAGINILGVLPEDRALLTFNLRELAELIDGKIMNDSGKTEEIPTSFMLGAMTVDSGIPYFNRMSNKVAVIRSERPDMQMAALQTSILAMVITGEKSMIPQVQNLAEDKKVPVILTRHDCMAVANIVEENLLKTRFHQKRKVDRMLELISTGFDLKLLSHSTGI
jgi:BioD-like phosphotransacetylase family protein